MSLVYSSPSLLKSIIAITEQRDRGKLESSLVRGLFETIRARHVTLHKLFQADGEDRVFAVVEFSNGRQVQLQDEDIVFENGYPLSDRPEFSACYRDGQPLTFEQPERKCFRYLYPIRKRGSVMAFLEINHDAALDEASQRVISGILSIYCNFLEILDYSEHDTLTGLLNRKTFDTNLLKILAGLQPSEAAKVRPTLSRRRSRQSDFKHWMGVIDIDHFKRINDQFGHLYGDEVLLLLARLMRESFRFQDKLFRFGGEEFVVLLAPTEFSNALSVFERFRQNVEEFHFPQVGRVTVSLGFTEIQLIDNPTVVFGQADEALYFAKQNGRNRVCSYEKLVESGEIESQDTTSNIVFF
ncbi:GGDEF domain-containing protein [Parachitinimonas caeni]|uniref:diguanylate cyclase n=1 Tax=Parachitinimonas caeni TaxID=3031301 RepID=A0ABT7DU84_9NEIS|nr:GGDEF domain-containing protein [Parachitinimonas caeni]MDK2123631.1 GGDEF domain-containing protein [Parachitinimonas caeni]